MAVLRSSSVSSSGRHSIRGLPRIALYKALIRILEAPRDIGDGCQDLSGCEEVMDGSCKFVEEGQAGQGA